MNEAPTRRLAWPDLARGLSVLLVVTHHVVRQMEAEAPDSWQAAAAAWTAVDVFMTPVRIPLFFFISGYLVAGRKRFSLWQVRRPWTVPAYLYLLWSTLLTLRLLIPGGDTQHSFASNLYGNLFLAGSGYWYIYALPVYYIYTRLTRRWPGWLAAMPLLVGLALRHPVEVWAQQLAAPVMDSSSLLGSITANGIFFWIGARYGPPLVERLNTVSGTQARAIVAGFVVVQVGAMLADMENFTLPLLSFAGIAVGALLASRAPQQASVSRLARYVGQRTLPVYVSQFFFISALSLCWSKLDDMSMIDRAGPLSWAYPAVIVALTTGASLLFYKVAMSTSLLAWLFQAPRIVRGEAPSRSSGSAQ